MKWMGTLTIAVVLTAVSSGHAAVLTVGADNACDYQLPGSSLQAAVDAASAGDELRLATNTSFDRVQLQRSVTLAGGFSDCTIAATGSPVSGLSIIDGGSAGVVLDTLQPGTYVLDSLIIQNGQSNGNGGGIRFGLVDTDLLIRNSVIRNNVSQNNGGGLGASTFNASSVRVTLIDTAVSNNTTTANGTGGGGIYMSGGELFVLGASPVSGNTAVVGGGVFLANSSAVFAGPVSSSASKGGVAFTYGLIDNTATFNGAGLSVNALSSVVVYGSPVTIQGTQYGAFGQPFTFFNNQAGLANTTGEGGALLVDNSLVELYDVAIDDNEAKTSGGGIAVRNSGDLVLDTRYPSACAVDPRCNFITRNSSEADGGALDVRNGATATIRRARFRGNRADNGMVMRVIDSGSSIDIDSSIVAGNGSNAAGTLFADLSLVAIGTGASWSGNQITMNDNDPDGPVFDAQGNANVTNSIVYNPLSTGFGVASANASCVIADDANETSAGTLYAIDNQTYQMVFVNVGTEDYRLADQSFAEDLCADSGISTDYFGNQRGFDDNQVVDVNGPFDAGADEQTPLLFADGFETN